MKTHWTAFAVGLGLGVVTALLRAGSGANVHGITGGFASPYQAKMDRGLR